MRYGIVQGLLGVQREEVFAAAASLGFDGVECSYGSADPEPLDGAVTRTEVRERARASGMAIPSLMIGTLNRGGLANDDPALQTKARRLIAGAIDSAPALGARVILVPFFFGAHVVDAAALDRTVAGLKELAPRAEQAGVTLAYEGELPADKVIELLDRVGSPALRCYYDVGNAVWLGFDPVAELRQLGVERIAQVHFKDIQGEGLTSLNDVMLGEGRVPLSRAAETLDVLGYDGWLVLETRSKPDPQAAAAQNLATLKRAFQRQESR